MTSRSDNAAVDYPQEPGSPLGDLQRGAFDSMNEEEQEFLRNLAREFIDSLENVERSLAAKYEAQRFDIEEGLAFWSLLPAKIRTAIKRGRGEATR